MVFKMLIITCFALLGTAFAGVSVIREGEYHLEWEVIDDSITVTAVAKTLGWVGFGISPFGTMMEADIIISGLYSNGTGYLRDRYAFANSGPVTDDIQNVDLISATENDTHTTVVWTRKLDTGDVLQDRPILNETQAFIWAWGPTDTPLYYHGPYRGTVALNLMVD